MARLVWSDEAADEVTALLTWLSSTRGRDVAHAARVAIRTATHAAVARPLAYA
jgi:plasmid stabilization system protein ParE